MNSRILKTISFLLIVIMVITVAPADAARNVFADDDTIQTGKCGDNVSWELDTSTGVLTISGSGYMYSTAYTFNTNVKKVVIKEGILSISPRAFYGSKLETITIPGSVRMIGEYAFWGCQKLETITLPANVQSIGKYAFEKCTSLYQIAVNARNDWFTSVDGVLYNKAKTKLIQYPAAKTGWEFAIPTTVTEISAGAFDFNKNIEKLTIPAALTELGNDEPFYGMEDLAEITVSKGNTAFSSIDGVLYNKDATTLLKYPPCKEDIGFEIPDSVTTVVKRSFQNVQFLASVTFPESVDNIEYAVFSGNKILKNIFIEKVDCTIASGALQGVTKDGSLIYGYKNSTAQVYADSNGYEFVALDEKEIKSIAIASMPKKLTYALGETFNSYGLKITTKYSDGTSAVRSTGFTVEGFDSSTVGKRTLTVNYEGKKATFNVEIVEELEKITIRANTSLTVDIIEAAQEVPVYFTPVVSGTYTFYSTGSEDTYVTLYDEEGNVLAKNDDGGSGRNFSIAYEMKAGTTYVYGTKLCNDEEMGSFTVTLENKNMPAVVTTEDLAITGFQMSTTLGSNNDQIGLRTVYQNEQKVEGQSVKETGLVYALDVAAANLTDEAMTIDAKNAYIAHYAATSAGKMKVVFGESETADYYAMTMPIPGVYTRNFRVRVYAVLEDGETVYSAVKSYNVYNVACTLYNNNMMNSSAAHEALYDKVISKVNSSAETVDYNWNQIYVNKPKKRSKDVNIEGFQMSASVGGVAGSMGIRTVYSFEGTYAEKGLLLGLVGGKNPITAADMVVGSTSNYVSKNAATASGKIDAVLGSSTTASYYAATMTLPDTLALSRYRSTYLVRAYAKTASGEYIYSDVVSYTIQNVAETLYQNNLMSTYDGHEALYEKILSRLDSSYEEVDYNWANNIIK